MLCHVTWLALLPRSAAPADCWATTPVLCHVTWLALLPRSAAPTDCWATTPVWCHVTWQDARWAAAHTPLRLALVLGSARRLSPDDALVALVSRGVSECTAGGTNISVLFACGVGTCWPSAFEIPVPGDDVILCFDPSSAVVFSRFCASHFARFDEHSPPSLCPHFRFLECAESVSPLTPALVHVLGSA